MEPWLRGIDSSRNPVIAHLLRASQHIREDAAKALAHLPTTALRATPNGLTSVGFHARHLAGSTNRLCAYLAGRQLTPAEIDAIPLEQDGPESADQLIHAITEAFDHYDTLVEALAPEDFSSVREVGRQSLPVTAISLAIHIAEHGQRHVGQAISAANLAIIHPILTEMRELAAGVDLAAKSEGMARYGIQAENLIGLSVPQLRALAKRVLRDHAGRRQPLAEQLWNTRIHDARILASLVADPQTISPATMDAWAADFASWDVCDACCYNVFDRSPHAASRIPLWAADEREFVRRAAFATLAGIANHDKAARNAAFKPALRLIEKYAFDNRNFVRKAVNWALRNIGKRNPALRAQAIRTAERIRLQNRPAARWIAADALRELRSRDLLPPPE